MQVHRSKIRLGAGLLAELFSGVLIVELLFSIPGLGWLLLDAAIQQDAPLLIVPNVLKALEHLAASCGRVNPEQTWRLYSALADCAGVEPAVTVDSPEVLVDGLVHQDGRRFVWLVSERDGPLVVHPKVVAGSCLIPVGGGDPIEQVELAPYGVKVLQLTTTEDEN